MVILVILVTIGPVKCNSNYFANIIFNNGKGNVHGNGGNRNDNTNNKSMVIGHGNWPW